MKSAALELGPYKITVNALIPGLIDTPLTRHEERYAQVLQDAGKRPAGSPTDEEEARKILTTKTPLGVPWIEPADVTPVVVFLASDAACMVSGATYDVNRGRQRPQYSVIAMSHSYATEEMLSGTAKASLPPMAIFAHSKCI